MKRLVAALLFAATPVFAQSAMTFGPCRMDGTDCSGTYAGMPAPTGAAANDIAVFLGSPLRLSYLTAGSALQVLRVNAAGTALEWAAPSGGGTPGGSDGQLQYNNAGAFAGVPGSEVGGANFYLPVDNGTSDSNLSVYPTAASLNANGGSGDESAVVEVASSPGSAGVTISANNTDSTNSSTLTVAPASITLDSAAVVLADGSLATSAGTALGLTATAPAATTGASQAGKDVTITASPAVASTDTAGAAAGGSVTITAGAAARNASGNANGGDIKLIPGPGVGSGTQGTVVLTGKLDTETKVLSFRNSAGVEKGYIATFSNNDGAGVYTKDVVARSVVAVDVGGGSVTFYADLNGAVKVKDTGYFAAVISGNASQPPAFHLRSGGAAGTAKWGLAAASPVAYTHTLAADSRAGTDTNTGGASSTITPGNGTGTGTPSTLIVQTPATVGSGTGAQTMTTRAIFGPRGVNIPNLETYADNTAALAGGLVAGDVYRTSAGVLMVTY